MKKVLIIGSSGLLGQHLYNYLIRYKKLEITRFIRNKKNDLSNINFCNKYFKRNKYEIIIYLSAVTDIDLCEANKRKVYKINFLCLKNLVNYSTRYNKNSYFIFTSTDQFYNKFKTNYEKKSIISNYYTKTKFLGENFLAKKNACVLRTNFFGKSITKKRFSFSDFIFTNLKNKKKIYLADDLLFSPVYIRSLCKLIYNLCYRKVIGKFNFGSKKGFSKLKFGIYFAKKLRLNTDLINKVSYRDLNFKVDRPKDMRMKVGILNNKLNIKLKTLKEEIDMAINDYK
tara:strand:+ start:94 stop:948 length:855 start_codon:yes stop_codon:yes gene_type:complete